MRVLHINNIANVAKIMRDAQRKLGVMAEVTAVKWRYSGEIDHPIPPNPKLLANVKLFIWILRNIGKYDVVHYHGKPGITAIYYSVKRCPTILHFHGSEIRNARSVPFVSFAKRTFVSTPDLVEPAKKLDLPEVEYLPNPVPMHDLSPVEIGRRGEEVKSGRTPNLVHLPTNRSVKGTDNLLQAIEILREMGIDVNLDIVEHVGPKEALERMKNADIVVDWVSPKYRIYGLVSIQAMALSIPVICHIDPAIYPEKPPIQTVDATPEGIAKGIKHLIESAESWGEIGKREREFALKTHDSLKIAKKLKAVYEEIAE